MNEHDLLKGIGNIDPKYVQKVLDEKALEEQSLENRPRVDKKKKGKVVEFGRYAKWGFAAAGIVVAAGGLIVLLKNGGMLEKAPGEGEDPTGIYVKSSESTEESTGVGETESYPVETHIYVDVNPTQGDYKIIPATTKEKLISMRYAEDGKNFTPSVAPYSVASDLSNVTDAERFYFSEEEIQRLVANNFTVRGSDISEFYDLYEENRYLLYPSFVTTDSMMHTYHLYFSKLLRNTEEFHLSSEIVHLTGKMLQNSMNQYEVLKGSEWEEAARTNVLYFSVAALITDPMVEIPSYVADEAQKEVQNIMNASGLELSFVTGEYEDYSQYKPRGYYENSEVLQKYFRTMMWYGRISFDQRNETLTRSAVLMNLAMCDQECYDAWYNVYEVTSFFAGQSDDLNYADYMPVIEESFGQGCMLSDLIGNTQGFTKYCEGISKLRSPETASFLSDNGQMGTKGYRLMGQRFNLDAAIFTQLVYSAVGEATDGDRRMLPDALDIPAALGSDTALNLLTQKGEGKYPNYVNQILNVRSKITELKGYWSSSLYGGWLFTLMPLLEEKEAGYPSFMTNTEWQKKDVESFLGSWTELKHDTVLYALQNVSEMGGGDGEPDDRGYVEPEPELYARLRTLSNATAEGLEKLGYIDEESKENLRRLGELSGRLRDISIKELQNEKLTDDEYELIKGYGGTLEHFWKDAMTDTVKGEDDLYSDHYPIPVVTDVATDLTGGTCLESAIGGVSYVYVVFPIDGELHVGIGGIYNYYQFEKPLSERMTDTDWRRQLGMEMDEDDGYAYYWDTEPADWTMSYKNYDE